VKLRDHLPIALNPRAVSLAEGARAGIAVAAMLIVAQLFNLPHFDLAALGALLTCFADPGGTISRRATAVIAFALSSLVAYAAFGLLRGEGLWISVLIAGLTIFATSYMRVYGQVGQQVGALLAVVIVLALGTPFTSLHQAAMAGLNFAAGAAWAVVLTLLIWRLHPYAPSRRAVAEICLQLAQLTKELASLANEAESTEAFEAHAATHRRNVREAMETARTVALETFRGRGLVTPRGAQLTLRLQAMEQIFEALIALSDTLESDPACRRRAARPVRLIAIWLAVLGPEIEADRPLDTTKKQASLQRLRAELEQWPADSEARHVMQAIADNFAVLLAVTRSTAQPLPGSAMAPPPLSQRVFAPLRANFSVSSVPMRHAARAAIVATPVLAWSLVDGSPYAHWAVFTLLLCLQPYFSATWLRSAERVVGTALGALVAAGIGLISKTQMELAFTMLPLTIFAFAIRSVSYTAYIAVLTPMIVLLIEQIAPGSNELIIAESRIGYTLLGGGLAILGNLLLWPGFEGTRLDANITDAIRAHIAYVDAVFAALLEDKPAPAAPRRAAGLASNNLEAALSRALLEPHKRQDPAIGRGAVVDAALRRMAGRLSVLSLDRPAILEADRPLWTAWQCWLEDCLSSNRRPRPEFPSGPGAETLFRLARQAELVAS
jgi:uncharacterized membrane protein YccC